MIYLRTYLKLIGVVMMTVTSLNASGAFDLTRLGVSAESIALGGVHTSAVTAHSIFINPALLASDVQWSVDMFHTRTIADVSVQNMSLSKAFKRWSVALGYAQTGMSDIPKTYISNEDSIIQPTGAYYAYKHHMMYAGSRFMLFDNLALGMSFKLLQTQLDLVSGTGINADLGMMLIKPTYKLGLGVHNVLPFQKMEYTDANSTEYEPEFLSKQLFLLGSRQFKFRSIRSTAHVQLSIDQASLILFSGGLSVRHHQFPFLEGLFGFRTVPHRDITTSRASMGVNLIVRGLKLSYAYEKSSTMLYDHRHYFSLSVFNLLKTSVNNQKKSRDIQFEQIKLNSKSVKP